MKRFRLSTLMLLIVIAALCVATVVQQIGAARRDAELRGQASRREAELQDRLVLQEIEHIIKLNAKEAELEAARRHSAVESKGVKEGDKQ
jgi:hypothetical protein